MSGDQEVIGCDLQLNRVGRMNSKHGTSELGERTEEPSRRADSDFGGSGATIQRPHVVGALLRSEWMIVALDYPEQGRS